MRAAASSDGRSWSSLAISSAERPESSAAPPSGPSSLKPSIARRLLRSASTENAVCRSRSGNSEKSCARSGGCCFLSRLTRFGVAPHAHEALHGVEHDIELALGHRDIRGYEWEPL